MELSQELHGNMNKIWLILKSTTQVGTGFNTYIFSLHFLFHHLGVSSFILGDHLHPFIPQSYKSFTNKFRAEFLSCETKMGRESKSPLMIHELNKQLFPNTKKAQSVTISTHEKLSFSLVET